MYAGRQTVLHGVNIRIATIIGLEVVNHVINFERKIAGNFYGD